MATHFIYDTEQQRPVRYYTSLEVAITVCRRMNNYMPDRKAPRYVVREVTRIRT